MYYKGIFAQQVALLETNPYLLGLTIVVSIVHSIFEFLAFKNGEFNGLISVLCESLYSSNRVSSSRMVYLLLIYLLVEKQNRSHFIYHIHL